MGDLTPRAEEYLSLLDRALEDRQITEAEQESLVLLATKAGIIREQAVTLHKAYLRDLIAIASAGDLISESEQKDIDTVARLLNVSEAEYKAMLVKTRALPLQAVAVPKEDYTGRSVRFIGTSKHRIDGEVLSGSPEEEFAKDIGSKEIGVLTWNVHFRKPSVLAALATLPKRPDIVTLQEVKCTQADAIQELLHDLGYSSVYSGNAKAKEKAYGNLIAARIPIRSVDLSVDFPWPQLVAHAALDTPSGPVNVISVHVPNGSGNGWRKIETLEALKQVVVRVKGKPLILTGDFNEPRWKPLQDGRIVTWGQEERDGRWVPWPKWTFKGVSGSGERWDGAVRWFFEGSNESGIRHALWDMAGPGAMEASHISRGAKRWFDHVFVSDSFRVIGCEYVHAFRKKKFSDHSAVYATLSQARV